MKGRIESLAVIPGLCGIKKKRLCISSQQSMREGRLSSAGTRAFSQDGGNQKRDLPEEDLSVEMAKSEPRAEAGTSEEDRSSAED